ncbi:C40 family peptidase [Microlunatus lacustris]
MTSRRREADHADLRSRAVRKTRTVRKSVIGLSTLALTVATFIPGASTASAAPTAVTIAEAKAQIEQLEVESAAIDQEWVGVKEQLDAGRAKLARKQADVKVQTAKVARVKRQVGQVALAQFQNRNVDTAAQIFFNSDSDNFMSQISTVEKVSENQNTVLQDFQEQQAALAELQHSSETDLATLAEQEQKLAELRKDSDAKVAESKKVLARLTAAERAAIAAAEKKAADEARAKAEAAAETTATSGGSPAGSGGTSDTTSGTSAVSGSSRGAKAVAFAKAQLGKPYRFGAAGPAAYDCSGLTGSAWKAAGVTLPRTSQTQIGVGRSVSRGDLQPGDLVFYYSGISHVGLYVGNGQIVHAPNASKPVQYAGVDSMPWAGARRPG